jgi:orotate phosphoribosyltransferase
VDRGALARRVREVAYLEGDFVLRSGQRSSFYLDKYRFETRPDLLEPIGAAIAREVLAADPRPDLLAGPELGAVALAAAASISSGLPFLIVRKHAKGHGTAQRLEGTFVPGQRVCVVEDVVTTAGAALDAIAVLRAVGLVCDLAVCVVDREEGGAQALAAEGVTLAALLRLSEIRAA